MPFAQSARWRFDSARGVFSAVVGIIALILKQRSSRAWFVDVVSIHAAVADLALLALVGMVWNCLSKASKTSRGGYVSSWAVLRRSLVSAMAATLLLAFWLFDHGGGAVIAISAEFFCLVWAAGICYLLAFRKEGFRPKRVVIVGTGRLASLAWKELRTHGRAGMRLAGFVDDRDRSEMGPDMADLYLGTVAELPRILQDRHIDEMIVATPLRSKFECAQRAIEMAHLLGVRVLGLKDSLLQKPIHRSHHREAILVELVPGWSTSSIESRVGGLVSEAEGGVGGS